MVSFDATASEFSECCEGRSGGGSCKCHPSMTFAETGVLHGCRSAEADAAAAAKQAEGEAAATKLRAEANLFAEMKRAEGKSLIHKQCSACLTVGKVIKTWQTATYLVWVLSGIGRPENPLLHTCRCAADGGGQGGRHGRHAQGRRRQHGVPRSVGSSVCASVQ